MYDIQKIASVFIFAIFLFGGLADLPRLISFGSFSGGFALNIISISPLFLLLSLRPFIYKQTNGLLLACTLFLAWVFFSFSWAPRLTNEGIQNTIIYTGFIVCIFTSIHIASNNTYTKTLWFKSIHLGVLVLTCSYLIHAIIIEKSFFISRAAIPLACLWGISFLVARWHTEEKASYLFAATGLLLITVLTSARMPLLLGILLIALGASLKGSTISIARVLFFACSSAIILFFAVSQVESLQSAFFKGDRAFKIGSIYLNTSGRITLWTVTLNNILTTPWIGQGAGTSVISLDAIKFSSHPHNDYLRLLHDFGIIGFSLWMLVTLKLFRHVVRAWQDAYKRDCIKEKVIHLTAILSLLACFLSMLTDNTIVYGFFMFPLGSIVGASIGISIRHGQPSTIR